MALEMHCSGGASFPAPNRRACYFYPELRKHGRNDERDGQYHTCHTDDLMKKRLVTGCIGARPILQKDGKP